MSDFEKQPWFIPVIAVAAVTVAGISTVGIAKIVNYFNPKESGSLRTESTSSNNTSVSSMSTTLKLPYGHRSAQGIKKSKKHNRKTKKRR